CLQIKDLVASRTLDSKFYAEGWPTAPDWCQGDILRLPTAFPFINAQGAPAAAGQPREYWVLVGNTCDLSRDLADVRHTQLVPIHVLPLNTLDDEKARQLRNYEP